MVITQPERVRSVKWKLKKQTITLISLTKLGGNRGVVIFPE